MYDRTYVKQLEDLICDVLIPVYMQHHRELGNAHPGAEILKKMIKMQKSRREVPALLKRPEKST